MREKEQYRRAVDALREGGVVALPTDTVYGLVAVAADDGAVRRIFEIKRRSPDQPLPLLASSLEQAELIAEFNAPARSLAAKFWPGALTLVLRKRPAYRTLAAAGGDTIGVRVPDDPLLREIAAQLGPLTGTSANRAGQSEARGADEVRAQLGDAVDIIVDAPMRGAAVPSTVADCTEPNVVRVLREGAIGRPALRQALAGAAKVI